MINNNPVTFQKKFDPLRALPLRPARALCHAFFELLVKATRSVSYNYLHRHAIIRSGGFTLLELLVVVALMAIVAGTAMISLDGVDEHAATQIAKSEMVEISKAIRQFKRDTGFYPGQGKFSCTNPPLTLNPDFVFPDYVLPATAPIQLAWCESEANFWMLSACPFDDHNAATEEDECVWKPDTARGWRGPYLTRQGDGKVNMGGVNDIPGLADPFAHLPSGADFVWDGCTDCKHGRPYQLIDFGIPNQERIVSYGPDGVYGGTNTTNPTATTPDPCLPNLNDDDLVLCLK